MDFSPMDRLEPLVGLDGQLLAVGDVHQVHPDVGWKLLEKNFSEKRTLGFIFWLQGTHLIHEIGRPPIA
ncbi:MAG TPA: hypothetical protein EYQ07_03370 [Candidatus Poseidoniales archaeon]|nr:hypothetical protein [Candidatus Poseidoniales archaeon]